MPTRQRTPRIVMWAAIGLCAALTGGLLALGWDTADVWATAASVLLLACVAVCVWAGAQGLVAEREVDRAIARLTAARRATPSNGDELHESRNRDP